MKRAALLVALPLLTLAAAWTAGHFDVRAEQLARNAARWASLPPAERDALRAEWVALRARLRGDGPEADQLVRRLGTLNRYIQEVGARAADPGELERQLATLHERVAAHLGVPVGSAPDPDHLIAMLNADTQRRMDAFLGNLSHEGRLDDQDLADFWQADWDGRVTLALELLKREALYFEAEEPRAELAELAPLDLAARQDQLRRRRGLLGRAGRLLDLDAAQSLALLELAEEDFERAFRDVVRPAARELLLAQGIEPARADELVARPYRSLERILERLLRARR